MSFAKSLFLAAVLLFSGLAQASPEIQHWVTANGARVYFVASPQLPMVDVRVVFDAGSARDGDQPGLAKLTNALIGEGAGDLDSDAIARRFDDLGADFSTDSLKDMAIVSLRSLTEPKLLQPALATLAEVLDKPSFPEKALARDRSNMLVALQQQQQSPGDMADETFFAALYGNHPYAHPSLGTVKSVKALKRQALIDFYHRYYVGRNAVVAIVGDLDRAGAQKLAAQVVGALPAGEPAPKLPAVAPLAKAEQRHVEFPSSQTHVLMGQPGIRRNDPDFFPLYVGNFVLGGGGLVSRISEEVREKRGLSYSAYSYFMPMHAAGPFTLSLQTRTQKTDEAIRVLRQTLDTFVAKGPTQAELAAAKRHITGAFPLNVDSNRHIVDYLGMIGFYHMPLDYLDTFTRKVQAVTIQQVRDAFHRRIHPQRMVTVTVGRAE